MIQPRLKSDELYPRLWNELQHYAPGEQFMSIRQIMRKFEVSQLVVDRTLSRLREEEFLTAEGGRGLFVSEKISRFTADTPETVLCAVPRWHSHDVMEMLNAFRELQPEFPRQRLLGYEFDFARPLPGVLPLLEENVKGILLHPAGDEFDAAEAEAFNRLRGGIPAVMFGRNCLSSRLPSASLDDTFAGSLAARQLHRNGHRKLAVLLSEPHNCATLDRVKGVEDYAELNELELEVIDCGVRSGEFAPGKTYDHMFERLQRKFDFTGIVGVASNSLSGLLNACHNRNIGIPGELSVVTIGSIGLTRTFAPPVDTVETDLPGQIKAALELLASGNPGNISLKTNLIEQGSVLNLNTK